VSNGFKNIKPTRQGEKSSLLMCKIVPNEIKISHRWRERARLAMDVFS
jgi:hypothetical protein